MDANTAALLHVQSSLLMALCSAHSEPKLLLEAFDFHLQQSLEATAKSGQMQILISAWANTFRLRMERPEATPPDEGQ